MSDRPMLSRNEALAILEEHDAPLDGTMRELLYWTIDHASELPYSGIDLVKAFFPYNPQNVRDSL